MLQIKNTLGGGKPEGLYVWKKNSVSKVDNSITKSDKNYTLGTATSDTTVYYSTSYTFDASTGMYTLVNPQSVTLAYNGSGGVASVQMEKSKYYIWGSTSSNEIYNTNANSKYNVAIRNASGNVYLELNAYDYKCDIHSAKTEYTFLDYIVSDKETAYPDGGEKGGYWYEKVTDILGLLGCTKISVETFIPTSNISVGYGTYTLNHGLGEIPKYAILLSEGATANNTLTRMLWMYIGRSSDYQTSMYEYLSSIGMTSLGAYRNSKSQNSTSTYITIGTDGTSEKLMAGVKYTLITMA